RNEERRRGDLFHHPLRCRGRRAAGTLSLDAELQIAQVKADMACSVAQSYDHCRRLARRTARNFYYSFWTLPRDLRVAMCVLYSFMGLTEARGDGDEPVEDRERALKNWQEGLVRSCEGEAPEHPVLPALVDVIRRYHIPSSYLLDVIAGVKTDLAPVSFAT